MKTFKSAYEAAEYAATVTKEWKSETDKLMTVGDLLGFASVADENNTVDEDDENAFYVVDDNGSVGITIDGGKMILWFAKATATVSTGSSQKKSFCTECGTELSGTESFCTGCGKKIERKPQNVFCTNCGTKLDGQTRFCHECGTPVSGGKSEVKANTSKEAPKVANPSPNFPSVERPHGLVGYSNAINDPEFIKGVNKEKSARRGCATFLFVAPLVIVPIYSLFSDGDFMSGLFLGAGISVLMMIISLLASHKERTEKPFDGVVEQRYEKKVRRYRDHRDDDRYSSWETHYFVVIRKDNGKKHTIEEKDTTSYAYLREGDRVRYHGKMGLLYPYEKYDKSHDEYVICAFCRTYAPIVDDTCPKCKRPLLK